VIGRRRRSNTRPWNLKAGDYCKRGSHWWVCLPSGVGPSRLDGWKITEHDDRTITVSPSIHDVGTPNGWHGFLERGVWRQV
jgi:hypothetical protein